MCETLSLILLSQASLEGVQIRLSNGCTRDEGGKAQMLISGVLSTCPTVIWGREVRVGSLVICECTLVWNKSCYLYFKKTKCSHRVFSVCQEFSPRVSGERYFIRKPSLIGPVTILPQSSHTEPGVLLLLWFYTLMSIKILSPCLQEFVLSTC